MCGICGIVAPDASTRRGEVDRMIERLVHRGPDAGGVHAGEQCVLGHRRLSIVDLSSAGNQPMLTGDQQVWLVGNGEIYNQAELRAELIAAGHVFTSTSDNEVLLHGWRAWGEALFPRINGMFACAIWEATKGTLILARDRLGIKPLYFTTEANEIRFASEIKALLPENATISLSPTGLAQFLTLQNTIGETTLFSGIRSLRPGSFLTYRNGTLTTRTFWRARFSDAARAAPVTGEESQSRAFDDAANRLRTTLEGAVDRHLMADVPASTYLSAGIDSSAVTCLAARSAKAIHCFTGTFDASAWYDEATMAGVVARHCRATHHVHCISPSDLVGHLDDLTFALDQPRMGMGAFPQYMLAREVARSHKVVLTGHGGDELFSGYPIFKVLALHELMQRSPAQALKALTGVRPAEAPHFVYFWPRPRQSHNRRLGLPVLFSSPTLKRLLRREVFAGLDLDGVAHAVKAEIAEGETPYEQLFLTYLNVYLPGLLTVEDKISMAHSVESRVPILDNEMVAMALDTPPDLKLTGWRTKAIPRHALRGLLPDELFTQPKRGFPTPLRFWLRQELAGWMRERLDPQTSPLTALFRPEALERVVRDFQGAFSRHVRPLDEIEGHRMWMLLCMDAWLRQLEARLGVSVRL